MISVNNYTKHLNLHPQTTKKRINTNLSLPGGSDGKESTCNAGDPGSIPGSGRSPGEGNGYPLQYSCWRSPWTEESGGYSSRGHKELDTT